jgi:peptidoglycan/xylan/chitin deacetylase (PgdA/CDA1 family)
VPKRGETYRRRPHSLIRPALIAAAAVLAAVTAGLALGGGGSKSPRAISRPASRGRRSAAGPAAAQARAVDGVLARTSYVALAGRRRREVALTFDDGPGPYTRQILAVLTRMRAKATFFAMGRWAKAYPKLVATEVRAGCEVGDHTETHPFLASLGAAGQSAQIAGAAAAIARAGAPLPRLSRPPYGSFDRATMSILRARRMLMVLWSADTKDYARPGARKIAYTAISGAQPGAIVLMHDGGGDRSQTVAALPRIVRRLRRRGFRLVTVSQLVADDPPPAGQPAPQPLSGRG